MKHIEESILLLGLMVTTRPFEYLDNTVSSTFSGYIEIQELKALKESLIQEQKSNQDNLTDQEKVEYSDSIYFIDKIIDALES